MGLNNLFAQVNYFQLVSFFWVWSSCMAGVAIFWALLLGFKSEPFKGKRDVASDPVGKSYVTDFCS